MYTNPPLGPSAGNIPRDTQGAGSRRQETPINTPPKFDDATKIIGSEDSEEAEVINPPTPQPPSNMNAVSTKLYNEASRLIKLLKPRKISSVNSMDKSRIAILHKETPAIQHSINDLNNRLARYCTSSTCSVDIISEEYANKCIEDAQEWVDTVHTLFFGFQLNIDQIDKKSRKAIDKFSRTCSTNVFEWLH